MNSLRLFVVALSASLLLAACGKDPETTTSANPLLAFVPADTPYVFANLQPVPPEILDAWLLRGQPFLDALQVQINEARTELASSDGGVDDTHAAVFGAVLAELDGKLSRSGLESLGVDLDTTFVVYGNGLLPVLRMGLGDAQALRAAIGRIESTSGQSIPELESAGDHYWRIADQDDGMAAYIAILDDHLAFSIAPLSAEATFLPLFLAQQQPQATQAEGTTLAQLNQAKDYTPYGSGYLDLRLVAEELLDPASRTSGYLATVAGYDPASIDPACASEARLATSFVPRMVAGVTELDDNSAAVQYQLEFERSLAAELVDLVSDVPAASSASDNLLAASLAIQVGRLREFARTKAMAMAAAPFTCPQLQGLNQRMQVFAEQLNQPMPLPVIANLMGLRAVITGVDMANPRPETTRGLLALEVENPQMVIGTASMLIPGFEELGIEPGAEPVQLTEELLSIVTPEFEVHAVMTRSAIGLSFGPGMRDALVPFMEEKSANDGAFASLDYDMAMLAGLQLHAAGDLDARQTELIEAYRAMAGRARLALRLTEDGLTIDSHTSFK